MSSSNSNRSLLALAAERSLNPQYTSPQLTSNQPYRPPRAYLPVHSQELKISRTGHFDTKALIKKLGLARLRKMQALVRGFLTRRLIYPGVLREYLVASSVADFITANVLYREASSIVVESVTLAQHDEHLGGEERYLEEYLYNAVVRRVVGREFEHIARQAVYEVAVFASRPAITYGFNLRDPLELLLFTTTNRIVGELAK